MNLILLYLAIQAGFSVVFSERCLSRDYGNGGTVCVCNKNHCDTVDPVTKINQGSFIKYTSNKAGLRFEKEYGNFTNSTDSKNKIVVRKDELFQKINGFGGAFTDATGINIVSLDQDVQDKLMRAYFSEEGIEYNLCRVPMAATDFSTHPYTYHDEKDSKLTNFTLVQEDYQYKLPLMHWARNLTKNKLEFFASTWIAPKWMKSNVKYEGPGGTLLAYMYQVWANYFLKFLDAYAKEGIKFWGLTTGNEPSNGFSYSNKIPSVGWYNESQRIWLRCCLGPTIRNSSHSDIKIMILDDQRTFVPGFIDVVFSDKEAYDFADGVGLHWYLDHLVSPELITSTQKKYPDKFFLGTEASTGSRTPHAVQLGLWARAEQYASDIIEDLNHWFTGWVDWNMVLDLTGGPTYISNFCDAPIIVNATGQEFLKQPMYYALGHFSKFIPRDSQKIYASNFSAEVPVTAFLRPDGQVTVVLMNKNDKPIDVAVEDNSRGNIEIKLSSNSITTIVYG